MALPPILVRIGADTDALDRGLNKAKIGLKGLGIAAAAAGVAVAAGLAAMTTAGLAAVDTQAKLARSMDATFAGLRAVQLAAADVGISTEETSMAMQKMNRELVRAAEAGTPAFEALERLGLTAADFAGLDVDERTSMMADQVQKLGLTASETSDIMRDLGVRSRLMGLLLIEGGDAIRAARIEVEEFGLTLTTDQIGAIEAANDAVSRMSLVFESLENRLAAEVAPILSVMAQRFTDLAKSDAVQAAIERLAVAFGDLAEIILTEDFMGAAISGLTTMAGIAGSVAEGMVFLATHVEVVTVAFSGLAIVVALAGGPLTIVIGLLSAALLGISAWRGEVDNLALPTANLTAAQDALNVAMTAYNDDASEVNRKTVVRATALRDQAIAALAAAKSETQLYNIETRRTGRANLTPSGDAFAVPNPFDSQAPTPDTSAESEKSILDLLEMMDTMGSGIPARPRVRPAGLGSEGEGEGDGEGEEIAPGIQSASAVAESLSERLAALMEGLTTEDEAIAEWYAKSNATLDEALSANDLTDAEHKEQRERLEQEHQDRLNAIQKAGALYNLSVTTGALADILNAVGQNNEKALQAAKVFGAAKALINTYLGASEALAGPFPANLAAAASVISAGIGFVSSIKSASGGGGGGGAGIQSAGGGGGGQVAQQAAQAPTQDRSLTLIGDRFNREQAIKIAEFMNDGTDDGLIIRGRV